MEFRIDFSEIDFIALKSSGIKLSEVHSILNNQNSYFEPNDGYNLVIGFSSHKKFIKMAYRVSRNVNFEIEALQIGLPNEEDIGENWCRG